MGNPVHSGYQSCEVGRIYFDITGNYHQPPAPFLLQQFVGLVHKSGIVDVGQHQGSGMAARRIAAAIKNYGFEIRRQAFIPPDGVIIMVVVEDTAENSVIHKHHFANLYLKSTHGIRFHLNTGFLESPPNVFRCPTIVAYLFRETAYFLRT